MAEDGLELVDVQIGDWLDVQFGTDKQWYLCSVVKLDGNRAKLAYIETAGWRACEESVLLSSLTTKTARRKKAPVKKQIREPDGHREVWGQKRKAKHHAVTPAAKRHSNNESRHSLGLASVKLEPADDDSPVTQLPLEERERLAAMVKPGYSLEHGFYICDADTSTSGAGGATLTWFTGSVVKRTASRGSKPGDWWLVHFVAGDRLDVLITASNCGTAWRTQGQQSLAEPAQAVAARPQAAAVPVPVPVPVLNAAQQAVKTFLENHGFWDKHPAVFSSLREADLDEGEWLSTLGGMPVDVLRQLVNAAVAECVPPPVQAPAPAAALAASAADPSWQMLANSSDAVNAAEPQPAGAMGHEQLATSVFSSDAVGRAMRRNTWQTDKTDEPALDLPGDACARLPIYTNASQTGPGAGFGAFASRTLVEGEYIGEVSTCNLLLGTVCSLILVDSWRIVGAFSTRGRSFGRPSWPATMVQGGVSGRSLCSIWATGLRWMPCG